MAYIRLKRNVKQLTRTAQLMEYNALKFLIVQIIRLNWVANMIRKVMVVSL